MYDVISSSTNPLIKRIRRLEDRKHRRREGAFFVEGIQPVWQAIEAGAEIDTLVVAPQLLTSGATLKLIEEQERQGTRVARVTRELFTSLADREHPAGLAAIVTMRPARLDGLMVTPTALFVALHRIGNPGNLGTIVRTADAAGATGVLLLGESTDHYHPAAVKASMGALFSMPVVHLSDPEEFFSWTATHGIAVVTTSARADREHWATDYPAPLALLLGSEGEGLPPALLARGDLAVRIPMTGTAHSLNLAVATGILLYEVRRRQR